MSEKETTPEEFLKEKAFHAARAINSDSWVFYRSHVEEAVELARKEGEERIRELEGLIGKINLQMIRQREFVLDHFRPEAASGAIVTINEIEALIKKSGLSHLPEKGEKGDNANDLQTKVNANG